jgi:hypothetical protein
MKKLLPCVAALAAGLALGHHASAAEKSVSWTDDACTHSIRFDPAKHDEKRLRNTIQLVFPQPDFGAPIVPYVGGDPQAIAKLDLGKFDQQCSKVVKTTRELELVPLKGIEDYRQAKVDEFEDACRFGNAKMRGLRNPSALRDYTRAPSCSHFIDALEGKSDIMKVFRETVSQQCSNNASPQRCRDENLKEAQKPDGAARVRLNLTTFGWSNCALNFTVGYVRMKSQEQMRSGLQKQFRQMFKVRSKCENQG